MNQLTLALLESQEALMTQEADPISETPAADAAEETIASDEASAEPSAEAAPSQEVAVVPEPEQKAIKPKSKKGKVEILPSDPIHSAAHEIENLGAEKARSMIKELIAQSEFDMFKIGGLLSVVHSKSFWQDYGFPDFKTYVETEHGFQYRKAMYLVSIYESMVELNIPWDKVKTLGWTKLKTLLNPSKPIVNAENIDEWVKKAEGATVLQLEQAIDNATKGNQDAIEHDGGKTISSLAFKLHSDQKATIREALEKAKQAASTEYDTVALEMIALEYLGKPVVQTYEPAGIQTPPTIEELMKQTGWSGVLEVFEKLWPNIELTADVSETQG